MKNCECPQNSCLLPENPSNLPLLNNINILSWYRIRSFSVGSFSCFQREKNCLVSFCLNFDWFLFQNHPYNLRDAVHQFRLTCEVDMIFFLNKQNCFIANAPSVSRINSTLEFLYQNAHTMFGLSDNLTSIRTSTSTWWLKLKVRTPRYHIDDIQETPNGI